MSAAPIMRPGTSRSSDPGLVRSVYDGVGSRFSGIVDAAVPEA